MTPKTRKETYLAKAAGDDVSIPEPITREEIYLNRIAENGGGGGGSGLPDVTSEDNGKGLVANEDGEWGKSRYIVAQLIEGTSFSTGQLCVIENTSVGVCITNANVESISGIGQVIFNFAEESSTVSQLVDAIKQYAALSAGTPVAKYYEVTGVQAMGLITVMTQITTGVLVQGKMPFIKLQNSHDREIYAVKSIVSDSNNARSAISWDMTDNDYSNSKIYHTQVTIGKDAGATAAKVYLVCTCYEATSLM